MPDTSKINILDSLRGFAALSVCLFHFVYTTTGFVNTKWILDLFWFGGYGVHMFFVISGFVIPWSMFQANFQFKNFFSFFLKRISRLEPPYLFSILLALAILLVKSKFLSSSNGEIPVTPKQILLHLGYLIPFFKDYHWINQVYWTLAIEFQYYLLIALIFIPLINTGFKGRVFIYTLLIGTSFFTNSDFLPYWLPIFLLGIVLFLFKAKIIEQKEYYITTLALIAIGLFKYPPMLVVFSAIPLISIIWYTNKKIPGLHSLGKFSYSLYLIHPIIGASLINILSHHVSSPFEKIALILGGVTVTLFASWINYLIIEKPSKKLSSSIHYKNSPQ